MHLLRARNRRLQFLRFVRLLPVLMQPNSGSSAAGADSGEDSQAPID